VNPDDVTVSRTDLLSLIALIDQGGRWTNESWLARCRLKLAAETDPGEDGAD
jgi:hypothetical protein